VNPTPNGGRTIPATRSLRPSPHPAVAATLLVALLVAACGASAAGPTDAPTAPAAPSAQPTPVATAEPTAEPTPAPSPTPVPFVSKAYGYALDVSPTWLPNQAKQAWDGEARIDSTGPYVESMTLPGNILFFFYGAPTDLDLNAYAAKTQEQMVAWHQCPVKPDSATDLALDGTTGRLHRMTCLGLFVQKLMVVRDGKGLVVNMLAPPAKADEARTLFEELVAEISWPA
jgi:hypothetical protein